MRVSQSIIDFVVNDRRAGKRRQFVVKAMQRYWRNTRGLTMGAQGLILDPNGNVVLIRHTYRPGWHFPGGGVEKNETVLTALKRELEEEAGVVITGTPELFGIYANFRAFPSDHIALYLVREWEQIPAFRPTSEIAEAGLFPIDQLPEGTIGPVRRRLAEVLNGLPGSETW
ncbi:MAG: hypothetical protein RLZ98_2942 [Pseudomonadota bacterium]|jgi:8-oxo-dGTP pyrophosphatase MutT (NUDIX family)